MKKTSGKYASFSLLYTALAIAVVIMANLLVNALPTTWTRFDATANDLFTLTQETHDHLDALNRDVTFYLLAETDGEDAAVLELLRRYEAENSHVHVEVRDPVLYPYFASQFTNLVLETNSVIAVSELRSTAINYPDFYPESYDADYNIITDFDGENLLTSALIYVASEELPVLYVTTGHGELTLPDALVAQLEQECYTVETLDLLTTGAMPADASVLVIHSPLTDFTADEVSIVQAWLDDGGRLLLFTDVVDEPLTNLNALMSTYGVYAEHGIILEGDADHHLASYPHYLFPDMADTPITVPLKEGGYRVMPALCQSLCVKADLRESLTVTPLLTTSEQAYLKAEAHSAETLEYVEGDKQCSFTLAYLIEEADARIIWYGTSMLTNEAANSIVSGSNTDLILNSINWLSQQESGLTIRSRNLNSGYLVMTAAEANTWQTITSIVLPLAVLAAGVLIWIIRRKR